MLMDIMVF